MIKNESAQEFKDFGNNAGRHSTLSISAKPPLGKDEGGSKTAKGAKSNKYDIMILKDS